MQVTTYHTTPPMTNLAAGSPQILAPKWRAVIQRFITTMETGSTIEMESTTETVFSQLGIGDCSTWCPPMWV